MTDLLPFLGVRPRGGESATLGAGRTCQRQSHLADAPALGGGFRLTFPHALRGHSALKLSTGPQGCR